MSLGKCDAFLICFNGKNYLSWKFHFKVLLKGKDLWGHVNGSKPTSLKDMDLDQYAQIKSKMPKSWHKFSNMLNPTSSWTSNHPRLLPRYGLTSRKPIVRSTLHIDSSLNLTWPFFNRSVSLSHFYSTFMILLAEYIDIVYLLYLSEVWV